MRGGLTTQPSRKLGIGQGRERLGHLGRFDVLVVDDQPLEERLVPLTPQVPGHVEVGTLAIGQQVERLAERVLDIAERRLGDFQVALGLADLGAEPLLLFAQQVDRHRPGVVGVQQLLALLGQLFQTPALAGRLGFGLFAHPGHRLAQLLSHRLGLSARQLHLPVGALDRRLDQIDRDVGLLAAGASHPPDAEEVGVAPAIAFGLDQPHTRAAAPAVERALQVVVVLSVLLGRVVVGGEHRLRLGEGRLVDQVLVAALVLDPGVADHAYVIGVLKQRRQLASRERLFGLLRRRPRLQAPLGQSGKQRVERVGAGPVGGKCPAHVRGALGIDFHRADFLALD